MYFKTLANTHQKAWATWSSEGSNIQWVVRSNSSKKFVASQLKKKGF
jgi:hypothetical protein